jgi:ribosomal protein L9
LIAGVAVRTHTHALQELDASRRALETTKSQALQAVDQLRSTLAAEKAALGKKYQVRLL